MSPNPEKNKWLPLASAVKKENKKWTKETQQRQNYEKIIMSNY